MPAEWEPHAATWLAWPHERTDWPGKFAPIPWVYAEIVRLLSRSERVCILIPHEDWAGKVLKILSKSGADLAAVTLYPVLTDRSWTRDFCPIFVTHGSQLAILDWHFNGWAKYANWERDDAVPEQLATLLDLASLQPHCRGRRVVLEGGSIDVNGRGTILATEECLLSPVQARNPELSRQDLEEVFRDYLDAHHTLWLRNGIAGDDTHGHIDDLARFCDPHTVVIAAESDPQDPNFGPLKENLALVRTMRDQDGAPLRVATVPMPRPVLFAGQRLPASYANFYIANNIVLVPTFNDPNDRVALNTLAELFPQRVVIGVASTDLVLGLGTLHCMTQQQPAP